MQATFTDEVSAINEVIAEKIGQQKFRVWFKNSTRLSIADDYLKIGVPNHFIGSWIESHFTADICDAVRTVTGGDKKIAFNIFPHIGKFGKLDYTSEEWKTVHETHKIMHDDSIKISATTVRVPVKTGHSESIYLETEKPLNVKKIRGVLRRYSFLPRRKMRI